jgi:hypothetical protein
MFLLNSAKEAGVERKKHLTIFGNQWKGEERMRERDRDRERKESRRKQYVK